VKKTGIVIFLFVTIILFRGAAQTPSVKMWDHRYGGTKTEEVFSLEHTRDGGYMLAGISQSGADGDKTEPCWDPSNTLHDYWLLKTDSTGVREWDKRFGGFSYDFLYSCRQTSDDGYILAGYSQSDSSGDKTEYSRGGMDFWILKTDVSGHKLWDKRYGGSGEDYLFTMEIAHDGGFLLGGYSASDSSGDRTQHTRGLGDYWIVKTDSLGNKQWDRRYGGSNDESLWSLWPTRDGGYLLGGVSGSPAGGDKTDALRDTCSACYVADYWLVKIDSAGNKEWDKTYGGVREDYLYSVLQCTDGGFILGGMSLSGIGFEKSQSTKGGADYWIIKTDSLGTIQWDADFGGNGNEDEVGNVTQTADGGFLIPGSSYTATASGDKTEDNLGLEQTWLVKTDEDGTKMWDKTIFTTGHDETSLALEVGKCFIVANTCMGDVGGYKTELNWDVSQSTWDYWVVKFCDSSVVAFVNESPDLNSLSSVYPNPFSNQLNAHFKTNTTVTITLCDYTGKEILRAKTNSTEAVLNTGGIAAGLYFLRVENGSEVRNYKVVKSQ